MRQRGTFADRVLTIVSRIPPGRVLTYGNVARLAGRPGAARAVGQIMRQASRPGLPYHRVIAAGGRLGGYGGAEGMKAALLRAEGIVVRGNRVVDAGRLTTTTTASARDGAKTRKRSAAARRSEG